MRMQNQLSALRHDATYQMDTAVQTEVKQVSGATSQLCCFPRRSLSLPFPPQRAHEWFAQLWVRTSFPVGGDRLLSASQNFCGFFTGPHPPNVATTGSSAVSVLRAKQAGEGEDFGCVLANGFWSPKRYNLEGNLGGHE